MPTPLLALFLAAAATPSGIFVDVTRKAGLNFVYQNGMTGGLHLPEIVGAGVAMFDFDNDGDLDVYLVQGGRLEPQGQPSAGPQHDRLLLNHLVSEPDGTRSPHFVDVSQKAGLTASGYGMGVATGDYDGDGWTDVLVNGYGSLRLLRNARGRRLDDVTARAGLLDDGWNVSATFFDYDRDGWLDLYVARYVQYEPVKCLLASTRRDYCGPSSYRPLRDRLFHNRGDGSFEDASATLLGPGKIGAGLGVVAADLNDDGWTDLYVANDGSDNQLWLNQAGRGFQDEGLLAGVALSRAGVAQAGMGTDAADIDGDGRLDLFVANSMGETHALYLNEGGGLFKERSIESGLATASLAFTGFGSRFLDYDNDGAPDLVVVNGSVHLGDTHPEGSDSMSLGQTKLLFHNLGSGRFADVSASAGELFSKREVSRGLATGDVDNDGDTDIVVANNMQPTRLLQNRVGQDRAWLGLRLLTRDGKRDALGARVTLRRRGAPDLVRHVHSDGSYASASDPRVLFGLGSGRDVSGIDVRWPDGTNESLRIPPLGRYTTARQGQGAP